MLCRRIDVDGDLATSTGMFAIAAWMGHTSLPYYRW